MRFAAGIVTAVALGGCAYHSETYVLLPQPDGRDSAIVITTSGNAHEIAKPYESIELREGSAERQSLGEKEVQRRFGDLLKIPLHPVSLTLFFLRNSAVLTPESSALIEQIKKHIENLSAIEIRVIGHADRLGKDRPNDVLSLRRAVAVRSLLLEAGSPPDHIAIVARGKREPLVPTADGVAEARNRRVEIRLH